MSVKKIPTIVAMKRPGAAYALRVNFDFGGIQPACFTLMYHSTRRRICRSV